MIVIRLLVLLVLCAAPVPALAQRDDLSERLTKKYHEGYESYQSLNRRPYNIHPVWQENILRANVILNWFDENMEARLRWVERQDWTREYKAMFVRAIEWHKDTFNGDPEKLYRLSHKYLHAPNAKKYGYDYLSGLLLYRAAMAGHPKAMAEYKDHPVKSSFPGMLELSRVHAYDDAVRNDHDAINTLVFAYLLGPIFDDDRIKGYYWFLRSGHLELSEKSRDRLRKSLSFLSKGQRDMVESWISSGHVPPM